MPILLSNVTVTNINLREGQQGMHFSSKYNHQRVCIWHVQWCPFLCMFSDVLAITSKCRLRLLLVQSTGIVDFTPR